MKSRNNANKMILDDLRTKILKGEYAVGNKLPPERELSEYYGVSRIPVREALKVLADDGIIEVKRGAGTFVKSTANVLQNEKESKIATFVKPNIILLETIRVRKILESEAASQAAKNIKPEEVDELEKGLIATIQEIRKLKMGEENDFFQADERFHRLIMQASHNPIFERCLDEVSNILSLHQYWSLKVTTPMDEVITYHSGIFENILLHNEEGARDAMMAHLSRVEEHLAQKIPEPNNENKSIENSWELQ